MTPIAEYSCIAKKPAALFFWSGYDAAVKYTCSSSAIVTAAGLVFIDPLLLASDALAELLCEANVPAAAIVLTSSNHQRASVTLAKKLSVPIYAPIQGAEGVACDCKYEPGTDFLGLHSVALPGFAPGETALFDEKKEILILGDALTNAEAEGLLPLPKKYCEDQALAKKSLLLLKSYSPTILVTAHGLPLVTRTSERLHAAVTAFC